MFVTKIKLRNTLLFDSIDFTLSVPGDDHAGVNILIGPPLSGKTLLLNTILHSIFGPWTVIDRKSLIQSAVAFFRYRPGSPAEVTVNTFDQNRTYQFTLRSQPVFRFNHKSDYRLDLHYNLPSKLVEKDTQVPLIVYYPKSCLSYSAPAEIVLNRSIKQSWAQFNPRLDALNSDKFTETISIFIHQTEGLIGNEVDLQNLFQIMSEVFGDTFTGVFDVAYLVPQQRFVASMHGMEFNSILLSSQQRDFVQLFAPVIDLYIRMSKMPNGVNSEAVVVMDEAGFALHPSWQLHYPSLLRRLFPRTQFIIATNSPFIAMSAPSARVFSLDREDKTTSLLERTGINTWWTIEQALSMFGISRKSPEMLSYEKEFDRLTEKLTAIGLTADEKQRIRHISSFLASADPIFRVISNATDIPDNLGEIIMKLREEL